jgi:hypothetical protein
MNPKHLIGFSIGLLLLASASTSQAWQQTGTYRWTGVDRVIAVGDIHGALAEFQTLLVETGLTDADQNWIGGDSHLVATGDILDRGAQSRRVMDLLRRLQPQAEAAGGKVHALLGNHEVMNMTGDLRYVLPEEFASYADLDPENAAQTGHQIGFLGHQRAFSIDGEYGAWLSTLPFLIVINNTAFLHGGLSEELEGIPLEGVNRRARNELTSLIRARTTLRTHGLIDAKADFGDTQKVVTRLLNPEPSVDAPTQAEVAPEAEAAQGEATKPVDPAIHELLTGAARSFDDAAEGLPFSDDGPVWYRRTAMCHPFSEQQVTETILAGLGATRVVIGHTTTTGRTIQSRMGGRVLAIDTGMNIGYYKGNPAALIIDGDQLSTHYLDLSLDQPIEQPNRTWARPHGMDDKAIGDFLRSAKVTLVEDLDVGISKPRRVTLEANGVQMRAIFKTVDTAPGLERGRWKRQGDKADRFIYDRAAYELDQILGLDMVPVAVTRSIDNEAGLLQYWVEGSISEKFRRENEIGYTGYCSPMSQLALMNVFDVLIHNDNRNFSNVLFSRKDWAVWLTDHTRAFRSSRKMPDYLSKANFVISQQLREALLTIDSARLAPLEKYLHEKQIQGIEARVSSLLKAK